MTCDILKYQGRMLRFIVDDYVPLKPDLKNPFQFVGPCPKTKKSNGIIVNEYEDSIVLPNLKETFIGLTGLRKFEKMFFKSHGRRRRSIISEHKARKINSRLRALSKKAVADGQSLLMMQRKAQNSFTDYELEFQITFYLESDHPLYHPESDNILCSYSDSPSSQILLEKRNFNDTPRLKSFRHCYLFHDLTEHKGVLLDDLAKVKFIWIDYELLFQSKLRGFAL